jgi:hypothetical protein
VCLRCDGSQKQSGLESWQWRRGCSRSGRALGVLCPVRASKAVVASLHLLEGSIGMVRCQAHAVPRLKRAMRLLPFAYTDYMRARPAKLLPSACSSRHSIPMAPVAAADPVLVLIAEHKAANAGTDDAERHLLRHRAGLSRPMRSRSRCWAPRQRALKDSSRCLPMPANTLSRVTPGRPHRRYGRRSPPRLGTVGPDEGGGESVG